jgi:hypothetical protein
MTVIRLDLFRVTDRFIERWILTETAALIVASCIIGDGCMDGWCSC